MSGRFSATMIGGPRTALFCLLALALISIGLAAPVALAEEVALEEAGPDLTERLHALEKAILAGDLDEAARLAKALTAEQPGLRAAWEVRAAVEQLAGGKVSDEVRSGLAWPGVPRPVRPEVGQTRYVNATALRLRAKPLPRAPVVAVLPMNTALSVVSVKGPWVEVRASVPAAAVLLFGVDAPPAAGPVAVSGFTKWQFLEAAPLRQEALAAEAQVLILGSDPAAALARLEKALYMDPDDRDLRRKLVRAALAAGRHELAVRTMAPLRKPRDGETPEALWAERIPVQDFFGCRGGKQVMTAVDARLGNRPPRAMPDHACLRGVDVSGECSPSEPFAGAPFGPEDACDDEYRGPNQSKAACQKEVQADQRKHERSLAQWHKKAERFSAGLDALRQSVPGPAWVRFQLGGSGDPARRQNKLFAWALSWTSHSCQDSFLDIGWAKAQVSRYGIPLPPAGEPLTVWVASPAPGSYAVGLIEAPDAAAAKARLDEAKKKAAPYLEPGRILPRPHSILPSPTCHCDGKPFVNWVK